MNNNASRIWFWLSQQEVRDKFAFLPTACPFDGDVNSATGKKSQWLVFYNILRTENGGPVVTDIVANSDMKGGDYDESEALLTEAELKKKFTVETQRLIFSSCLKSSAPLSFKNNLVRIRNDQNAGCEYMLVPSPEPGKPDLRIALDEILVDIWTAELIKSGLGRFSLSNSKKTIIFQMLMSDNEPEPKTTTTPQEESTVMTEEEFVRILTGLNNFINNLSQSLVQAMNLRVRSEQNFKETIASFRDISQTF